MPLTEHVDVFTAAATTHILSTLEGALVEAVDHATHTTIYATATADANGAATLTIDPPRVYCLRIDGVVAAADHQYGSGEQPRPPGVVIAASGASLLSRAWADRVCDGTNDEVDLEWARDQNVPITLTEGTFTIGATYTHNNNEPFLGQGPLETIFQPAAGFAGPVITFEASTGVGRQTQFGNFSLIHDRSAVCDGLVLNKIRECTIKPILVRGFKGYGLRIGNTGIAETNFENLHLRGNGHLDTTNGQGTATAGGASTLTDAGKAWVTDEWLGYIVTIRTGTGHGQTRKVTTNSATVLTVTPAWALQPDATSVYLIEKPNLLIENDPASTDGSNNLIFNGGAFYGGDTTELPGVTLDTGRQIVTYGLAVGLAPRKVRFLGSLIHARITGGAVNCDLAYLENPENCLFDAGCHFNSTPTGYDAVRIDSYSGANRGSGVLNSTFYSDAGANVTGVHILNGNGHRVGANYFHGDNIVCINVESPATETLILPNSTPVGTPVNKVIDTGIRTRNYWEKSHVERTLHVHLQSDHITTAFVGAGALDAQTPDVVVLSTGAVNPSSARATWANIRSLGVGAAAGNYMDWDKDFAFSFVLCRTTADANAVAYVNLKNETTHADMGAKGVGIKISNLTVALESYGASRGTSGSIAILSNVRYLVEIRKRGNRIDWSVDGAPQTAQTTAANIPSGDSGVNANASVGETGVDVSLEVGTVRIDKEL